MEAITFVSERVALNIQLGQHFILISWFPQSEGLEASRRGHARRTDQVSVLQVATTTGIILFSFKPFFMPFIFVITLSPLSRSTFKDLRV